MDSGFSRTWLHACDFNFSESLNAPPAKKAADADAILRPAPVVEPASPSVNADLPTLGSILARPLPPRDAAPGAQTVGPACPPPTDDPVPPAVTGDRPLITTTTKWKLDPNTLSERLDPSSCTIPTMSDLAMLKARVIVLTPELQYTLHCDIAEMYLMDNLGRHLHGMTCGTPFPSPQTNPLSLFDIPIRRDYFSNDISVVRPGGKLFSKHFQGLQICLPTLLSFVLTYGEANEKRDGSAAVAEGDQRRISFGCAGQAHHLKPDAQTQGKPKETYGFKIFDLVSDVNERQKIKQMLADIADAMQLCTDEIEVAKLHNALPFNDEERFKEFAFHLREKLGALYLRQEDYALQAKCLSYAEPVHMHKDDLNGTWRGYTKTNAFNAMLKDAYQKVWHLSMLGNGRKKCCGWLDSLIDLAPILCRIRRNNEAVDQSYQMLLVRYYNNRGPHVYPEPPTYKTYRMLVLDDHCPWVPVDIGGGVTMEHMEFPALPVRSIFLSAPATVIYEYHKQVLDARKSVRLAILTAYMTGYHRFYYLGRLNMMELVQAGDPAIVYYQKALATFKKLFGGPHQNRISPSGIKWDEVYLTPDKSAMNPIIDQMVEDIIALLDWISQTAGTEEFHHCIAIEERVQSMLNGWPSSLDIKEFRIMIVVQILVLAGIVVKPNKDLKNLIYPVSQLGAAKQLEHIKDKARRPRVLQRIIKEIDMEDEGTDAAEGGLCEGESNRVGKQKIT